MVEQQKQIATSVLLTQAFGMRLRERREERGLLQRELAQQVLGKDDQTIVSRWENGRTLPSPKMFRKLNEALVFSAATVGTWRAAWDARQAEQAGLG